MIFFVIILQSIIAQEDFHLRIKTEKIEKLVNFEQKKKEINDESN